MYDLYAYCNVKRYFIKCKAFINLLKCSLLNGWKILKRDYEWLNYMYNIDNVLSFK